MFKLLDYINESEVKELSNVDKKMLSLIHDKVWEKHKNNDKVQYDVVEELRNLDEKIIFDIYVFLKNIMGFDDIEQIDYFIKLFVNNFQEDGDYNKLTQQSENIIPQPNNHHQAVANNTNIPTTLVIDKEENWDKNMHVFYNMVNEDFYQVGNEEDTLAAINDRLHDKYYNFYQATQYESMSVLVNYLYIDDSDKRIVASEYAKSLESSNDIDKIIRMIKDYDFIEEDIKLIRRYYQLEHNLNDSVNSGIPKKVEMEDIENSLRNRLKELVYNDEYDKMDNFIVDWLMDHGYLRDNKYGEYVFTKPYVNRWDEPDMGKLPRWLNFDNNGIIDAHTTIDRAGELSNIDDYYDVETINDDTYYIIPIDY